MGRTPPDRKFSALAAIVLLLAVTPALGCRGGEAKAIEAKCDASLRMRAEEMAKAGEEGSLEVLGRASGPVDDLRRRKLTEAGALVGVVNEDMFTARIPVKVLGQVALLSFVKSLQLSQQREPLTP